MPPETAGWRRAGALIALAWAALIALFWPDWLTMADHWWNISTYNHILFVPPIIGWLIWQRRDELARIVPRAGWWPGMVLFALAALLWLLGAFSGLSTARQAGAVAMALAATLTLLGARAGAALAFPLGYALFLVPFGDELVPPLQMLTAWLTIGLVRLSAIPATIEGVFIDTPAGLFEVAEACSGVKFLVAMLAFGVLAANLCFVSWRRRAVFLALCVIVPILANGVRAWATVLAAQYVGAQAAAGFDHIVYGWIFFAIVIALVIGLAWRWFDRDAGAPLIDGAALAASSRLGRWAGLAIAPFAALTGLAMLAGGAWGWASAAERLEAPMPRQIFLPQVPGWHRVDYAPRVWWAPRASGAQHRLLGRYADGSGQAVDVFVALYAAQREGVEAGGYGEGALQAEQGWSWQAQVRAPENGRADRLVAPGGVSRLAETYYRTGAVLTGSNARLKLATMGDRLRLAEKPTMLLILSAEDDAKGTAPDRLARFRASTGPLGPWMDRMAQVR